MDIAIQAVVNESGIVQVGSKIIKYGLGKQVEVPKNEYDGKSITLEYFENHSNAIVENYEIKMILKTESKMSGLESRGSTCEMVWRPTSCGNNLKWKQENAAFSTSVSGGFLITVQSKYYKRNFLGGWSSNSETEGMGYNGSLTIYYYNTVTGQYTTVIQNPSVGSICCTSTVATSYGAYFGTFNSLHGNIEFDGSETDAFCITTPDDQICSTIF